MKPLMKSKEVREIFEWSATTLWRHRRDEGFPAPERVGRSYRWAGPKVEAWARAHGVDLAGDTGKPEAG